MKILSKRSVYPQQASETGRREAETSVLIFRGSTGLVPHTFTEAVCPASLTFQSPVCRNYPDIEPTELHSNYKFLKIRNKAFKLFTQGIPCTNISRSGHPVTFLGLPCTSHVGIRLSVCVPGRLLGGQPAPQAYLLPPDTVTVYRRSTDGSSCFRGAHMFMFICLDSLFPL